MFDLDLTKFAFLSPNEGENGSIGRESSTLPRPRLSKKNLKLHSERFAQSPIRVEVSRASTIDSDNSSDSDDVDEIDKSLKTDFDYDYASIYSEFSDCDSGHQTVSGCGSVGSRNKNLPLKNGLLAPTSQSKSGRFRSVSFNENDPEEQDEDGYSFVSYNSASAAGIPNKNCEGGSGCSGVEHCNGESVQIVGSNFEVLGPFGPRKCVYLDQGRPISEIELFIKKHVLPFYSEGTTNSKLIEMRNEARQIIHQKCGGSEDDQVTFCHGSNPIQTLTQLLKKTRKESSPVVIIGPSQSSVIISAWRMIAHEVVIAPINVHGQIDLKQLEGTLKSLRLKRIFKSRLVIGSFSVGSDVSGILNNDDVAITALLHKYGAYSVWDYGVGGPHLEIKINPKTGDEVLDKVARKDAIFFSGSRFMGGPQTLDVLVAKKSMFRNQEGLTDFVKSRSTSLIGEIRLGLIFQVQNSIGPVQSIIEKETDFTRQVLDAWGSISEIMMLGSPHTLRLPIISFLIKHPETGYFLHHSFVAALLRDLFGIQTSTGFMSDSRYAQQLLGIDDKLAKKYEQRLQPGFITISLPHIMTQEEITFAIEAVQLVSSQGWKLLPFYEMDDKCEAFRFSGTADLDKSPNVSITSINCLSKQIDTTDKKPISKYRYDECLTYGKDLIGSIEMMTQHNEITQPDDISSVLDNSSLRWFLTPSEALMCIKHPYNVKAHFGNKKQKAGQCPFTPQRLTSSDPSVSTTQWTRGSIPYNYNAFATPAIPPLPPRLAKKSSSLKSLDMKMTSDAKKISVGGYGKSFSRREFQSHLNSNYFGTR